MDLTLSQELRIYADQLERDYYEFLPSEEREEQAAANHFVENLTKLIVLHREVLAANQFARLDSVVHDFRHVIDRVLDRQYTLRQLDEVPGLVSRTLRLAHLSAHDTPSKQTNRYLAEATRSFIKALPLASVALSRAALEQGLKERLGRQGRRDYTPFETLVREVEQRHILSPTGARAAMDLNRRCNAVLHQQPIKDEEAAFEVLTGVRSILEELFAHVSARS